MSDVWTYRPEMSTSTNQLAGFDVEATDGSIGNIDEATNETGASYIVVDTGFWIFGKKRLIPARAIRHIDLEARTVHLNLTKDQVKSAPDYDEMRRDDPEYRHEVGGYYERY